MTEGHRTPRSYCPTPDCCSAPKRGVCSCQVDAVMALREAQIGRKRSPETIAKLRGRKHSPEAIAKMRGRKHSPETIAKMRGRKHSPETIAKMRAANPRYVPVPDHLKSYAAKLRRCGIRGEALRIALESAT